MVRLLRFIPLCAIFFSLICAPVRLNCAFNPLVAEILDEGEPARWVDWIAALSGARPIPTADGKAVIQTRSSFIMFEPAQEISAFTYLQDQLIQLGFKEGQDYEIHTYDFPFGDKYPERNWRNLILTYPGDDPMLSKERVLLVAHLDSTSDQELVLAPGADDNASGAAGLLETAAALRHYNFDRTIHLIWFSGEEQSRLGSEHFVRDYADWLPDIVGVINLDMFSFDWDNDRCFEVHAGTLQASQQLGTCMASVINHYHLDLRFDFIDDNTAYTFADHNPFWEKGVPGIMIFENFFYQPEGTCGNADRNNHYHTISDTLTYINRDTGFAILQAAIATLAHAAGPQGHCFHTTLQAVSCGNDKNVTLNWDALQEASVYQVWIHIGENWHLLGETHATRWIHPLTDDNRHTAFQVIAVTECGCQSAPAITHPSIGYFHYE